MARFRGVILDIDGTLVDSNDAHAHAWVEAFAGQLINIGFTDIRPLIGMGGDKLIPKVSGIDPESEKGKRISALRMEVFQRRYLDTLRPTAGAENLLKFLKDQGFRMVIATSAKKKELDGLMRVFHGDQYIEHATSTDDAEESKPAPDIIEVAMEKIKLPKDQLVMLGDTVFDVIAATRAGIPTIALRCGGTPDDLLDDAIEIYDDPADLLVQFADSPLA